MGFENGTGGETKDSLHFIRGSVDGNNYIAFCRFIIVSNRVVELTL